MLGKTGMMWMLCAVYVSRLCGQDTTRVVHISEVEVAHPRLSPSSHAVLRMPDSARWRSMQHSMLSEVLSQHNSLHVRSYGPSMLASPASRGTQAHHTALIWEGVNLQSSMNGQVDLGILPVGLFESISWWGSAEGATLGNGAVGGALSIQNQVPAQGTHAKVVLGMSSIGQKTATAGWSRSGPMWYMVSKVYASYDKNTYRYRHEAQQGLPIMTQHMASAQGVGTLQKIGVRISERSTIQIDYWGQQNQRNIAPIVWAAPLPTVQEETHHRMVGKWMYHKGKSRMEGRQSWMNEHLGYYRQGFDTSTNRAHTYTTEYEYIRKLHPLLTASVGTQWIYVLGMGDNISKSSFSRYNGHAFLLYQATNYGLKAKVGLRLPAEGNRIIPPLPVLWLQKSLWGEALLLSAQYSGVYRFPTLNDLYWRQAGAKGNTALLPERGFQSDVSLQYIKSWRRLIFTQSITCFYGHIDGLLVWRVSSQGLLQPTNVQKVINRGLEWRSSQEYSLSSRRRMVLTQQIDQVYSTVVQSTEASERGKQLIYTPYQRGSVEAIYKHKYGQVRYHHAFTGFRYTSEDNTAYIPAYHVGTVSVGAFATILTTRWEAWVHLHNVWNQSYSVLPGRPMPLRYISAQLSVNL